MQVLGQIGMAKASQIPRWPPVAFTTASTLLLSAVENLRCLPIVFAHLKAHGLLVADIQTDFPATHNNVGNDDKNRIRY